MVNLEILRELIFLSQLAFNYRIEWDNNLSVHIISNGYLDGVNNAVGITEAYVKYRSMPNDAGLRTQFRAGFIYKLSKQIRFHSEYNWIKSTRPSRYY